MTVRRVRAGAVAAVVTVIVSVLLGGGLPAAAGDRLDRVGAELKRAPLFVDADTASLVDAETRTKIVDSIEGSPVPVFVVVISMDEYDESRGKTNLFLHNLYRRMNKDGVYVVMDDSSYIDAVAFSVPREIGLIDLNLPYDPDNPREEKPGRELLLAIQKIAAAPPGETERPQPYDTYSAEPTRPRVSVRSQLGIGLVGALVGAVSTLPLVWVGGMIRRRVTGTPRRVRGGGPARWSTRRLSTTARREVRALGADLQVRADQPPEGNETALAAYDAALLLAGESPGPGELVAVIALARAGRSALDGPGRIRLCSVNPLHPPAKKAHRRLPNLGVRTHSLCAECRADQDGLTGRVLRVEHHGQYRPYYASSAVWRNAVSPDLSRLIERVRESLGVD